MASTIVFEGAYDYETDDDAEEAVREARAYLEIDDEEGWGKEADLAQMVVDEFDAIVVRSGATVRVQVHRHGPPGLYSFYEGIVEALAARSRGGLVTSEMEGATVQFHGGSGED